MVEDGLTQVAFFFARLFFASTVSFFLGLVIDVRIAL
jgi:hypothetical protein